MGNQHSHCPDGGVWYPPSMSKVEVLSLHGQTGQVYRQAEPSVASASTSPATDDLHNHTDTQAEPPVAATSTIPVTDAVPSATGLDDQNLTQAEPPVATRRTIPSNVTVLSTEEHLDQANTQAETAFGTTNDSPATDAVLSTTELVEQILSYFDIKELILLRRVSRHWSDVMAESPMLQRIMFLTPEPHLPFEWHLRNGLYEEPYLYTKGQFGTWMDLDILGYESSQFNPLLFERRPDTVTGSMDETRYPFHSPHFYPRLPLKDVGASRLFSQMLIAQPPVNYARVGCKTAVINIEGIRVNDILYAMKIEVDDACEFGHVLSIFVEHIMFPTREEEQEGQMVRQRTKLEKTCADSYQEGESLRTVARRDSSESGYSILTDGD